MNIQRLSNYGPLPIRILAGISFIAHGIPKLVDPAMTQGFFGNIGLPPEMAIPIGLLEVIGGFLIFVTGPGRISVEYDVIKREIFPHGKNLVQQVQSRASS